LVPLNKYVFRQKNHWLSRAALLTLHHKDKTVFCFYCTAFYSKRACAWLLSVQN